MNRPDCRATVAAASLAFAAVSAGVCTGPALGFEESEVRAIVRNRIEAEERAGAGGVWMAREKVFRMDGIGGATEREHLLARVYDPAWGSERFQPFVLDYWSENQRCRVLAARIWRPDLTFIDLPREAVRDIVSPLALEKEPFAALRRVEITFPDLAAEEVVEIVLDKARSPRPGEHTVQWLLETFGAEEPIVEHRLEIQAPPALSYGLGTAGPELLGRRGAVADYARRSFLSGRLPALPGPVEGGMFSRRATAVGADSLSTLAVSTTQWEYLSEYLGRQWWVLLQEVSGPMAAEVGRVYSENADLTWRAKRLERYVREEFATLEISDTIRGARPVPPADVFAARSGGPIDKAMFLTACLRLAGIDATPVAVRTLPGPWVEQTACIDQLDRYLVRADLDDPLWLDPVEETTLDESVGLAIPIFDPRTVAQEEESSRMADVGLIPFPGRP